MSLTTTTTGRTRHRVLHRWFRKPLLVLQIEYHVVGHITTDSFGSSHDVDYREWRDARTEDISIKDHK